MRKYSVDFFIKKFSKIPHSKWIVGHLNQDKGKHCALGHCGANDGCGTNMSKALGSLFYDTLNYSITTINDYGTYISYSKRPKTRVLAALRKIKKKLKE